MSDIHDHPYYDNQLQDFERRLKQLESAGLLSPSLVKRLLTFAGYLLLLWLATFLIYMLVMAILAIIGSVVTAVS